MRRSWVFALGAMLLAPAVGWAAECGPAPTRPCAIGLALAAAQTLPNGSKRQSAMAEIAEALVGAGDFEGALAPLAQSGPITDHPRVLTAIVKPYAAAGDLMPVLRAVANLDNDLQRALAYVAVGRAAGPGAAARAAFADALATARGMFDLNLRTTVISAVAEEAAKTGDAKTARSAVAAAEATAAALPHPQAVQVLAEVQAAAGDIKAALATAAQIADSFARVSALARIAAAQGAARNVAGARETLTAALAAARQDQDPERADAALIRIVQAQLTLGDTAAALATAGLFSTAGATPDAKLEDYDLRDSVLGPIAAAMAESGDLAGALAAAGTIRNGRARAQALIGLAEGRAAAYDVAGTRTAVKAALAWIDSLPVDFSRVSDLAAIAGAQATVGDIKAALATAHSIAEPPLRTPALSAVVTGFARNGDATLAARIGDPFVRASAFATIALGHALVRNADSCRRAIAEAAAAAADIDDRGQRARALLSIGDAQMMAGDVEGLRRTLAAAFDTGEFTDEAEARSRSIAAVAAAQANGGDATAALATAGTIADAALRAELLLRIAQALPAAE